jgi:hypothetical protein
MRARRTLAAEPVFRASIFLLSLLLWRDLHLEWRILQIAFRQDVLT